MASPQASQKFRSGYKVEVWDHDPNTASASRVTPDAGTTIRSVDMSVYKHFVLIATNGALTGAGITKAEIIAADNSSLSTNVVVIKDSGPVAADALGDWVILECCAEEVRQESEELGYNSRYVGGRLTLANSADESIVIYISEPRFARLDLTPSTTIA